MIPAGLFFLALLFGIQSPLFAEPALASLAEYLGPERSLELVSWEPVDFQKAVRAGFTTVWIGAGSLSRLPREQQEALLRQAASAGLRTLGFIAGDPEWANPNRPDRFEKVAQEYYVLMKVLEAFLAEDSGHLQFAFATDVEPYASNWWDGDLTGYSDMLEQVVIPMIERFSQGHPGRVRVPLLTRFEPFWWDNGRRTESGAFIHGLRDFPSDVASMTYRDNAEELEKSSRLIRRRCQRSEGVMFLLGVETKPPGGAVPAYTTFYGRLEGLPGEVIRAIDRMPPQERRFLRGVFIHSGKRQAGEVLEKLL